MTTPVNKRSGGLSMPKPGSADAALQALMNEQKAGIVPPPSAALPPPAVPEPADTGIPEYLSTGVPDPANTSSGIPAFTPVQEGIYKGRSEPSRDYIKEEGGEGAEEGGKEGSSTGGSEGGREGAKARGRAPSPATARARSREALKAGALPPLEEAVRDAIGRGRKHATDQKTSIDMPRSIMRRAKRYLFDEHNEAAFRLLIAELLDEFLTREGYPPEESGI